MDHVYVLGIPDLQQVLNHEDIAVWELFLLTEEKRYEKIRFQVSDEGGSYTFKNIEVCNNLLSSAEIDFDNKKIIFTQGESGSGDFEKHLLFVLSQLFVRVESDRIQCLATPKKKELKRLSTRR